MYIYIYSYYLLWIYFWDDPLQVRSSAPARTARSGRKRFASCWTPKNSWKPRERPTMWAGKMVDISDFMGFNEKLIGILWFLMVWWWFNNLFFLHSQTRCFFGWTNFWRSSKSGTSPCHQRGGNQRLRKRRGLGMGTLFGREDANLAAEAGCLHIQCANHRVWNMATDGSGWTDM